MMDRELLEAVCNGGRRVCQILIHRRHANPEWKPKSSNSVRSRSIVSPQTQVHLHYGPNCTPSQRCQGTKWLERGGWDEMWDASPDQFGLVS